MVLGNRLALEPVVLLLDEPTRGVDVGAKARSTRCCTSSPTAGWPC
ncbi:MAG: hypothetical protein R3F34_10590 [Planctomycetota bacterium]